MSSIASSESAKATVRRNTEEVQGRGNFEAFEELFADDFIDHTPQPGTTPDKTGVRKLYTYLRIAFPDFHAEIHWQLAAGDRDYRPLGRRQSLVVDAADRRLESAVRNRSIGYWRTTSYRYSVGLVPQIRRNTRAKCCCVLNPHATATSRTRASASRNISFARSILLRNTNWCGVSPVDWRNIREK